MEGTPSSFLPGIPGEAGAKKLTRRMLRALCSLMEEKKFGPIIAHAPYTLNACSADAHTREFALQTMADDLLRMEYVPGNLYNFHPGSHVGQGPEEGIRLIAEALNDILRPEMHTTVLLETMAGKGSEVAAPFRSFALFWIGWNFRIKWASAWILAMFMMQDMIL